MGKYDFAFDLYEDSPLAWIARTVAPRSRVLEFGAAHGRLTRYLAAEKNCSVDIVEIDSESGAEAAEYAAHSLLGHEMGDIEKYHWRSPDSRYDYIIFADVLEHLLHPGEVLKQCRTVIVPEGKILVSIPNFSHNSIIIELFNDHFNYTPIGLLDNTHVRFFTRQSFIALANEAGWAVIAEQAKNIRVGETEIANSYADVPKEVAKALLNRDNGTVYQYMFTMVPSEKYLRGQCERVVSLDACSYYFIEILYGTDGRFDYKHSISKYINPCEKTFRFQFPVLGSSSCARVNLVNCNAVIKLHALKVHSATGVRSVQEFKHNGLPLNGLYFFTGHNPEIYVPLAEGDTQLEISADIVRYDFIDSVYGELLECNRELLRQTESLKQELQDRSQTIAQKERELSDCNRTITQKERELSDSIAVYEAQISKKDAEFLESVQIYEGQIKKKDAEFLESVNTYENQIRQNDLLLQDTIKRYEALLQEQTQRLQNCVNQYEVKLKEKTDELSACHGQLEEMKEQKKKRFPFLNGHMGGKGEV